MKRMFAVVTVGLLFAGLMFAETNTVTDEKALENLVNSAKSNAQAYKANQIEKKEEPSTNLVPERENQPRKEKTTIDRQNYTVIPFSFTIVPICWNGLKTIDHFQINIGVGYCDVLQGLSLGFVNLVGEDAKGADLSLVSFTANDFYGVQASLVTFTGNDFHGTQAGLVNLVNGNFSVIQAGLVNYTGGNFDGCQAGLVNLTGNSFNGVECGLVNLTVRSNDGVQAGLVNIADRFKGIQVGLVNFAGEMDGVSIGLVSVVAKNGQTHAQVYMDETGFGNVALIHGSKSIYNIYTVGMDLTATYWSYGLGLGAHLPLDPFYINIEVMSTCVSHIERWDGMNTTGKLRIYAGFSLFEHLSVIAGVSLNYYQNWDHGDVYVAPFYNVSKTFENGGKIWPGFFVGITF